MMRRILLALYGLGVGAGYAALLQAAVPAESSPLSVRGLNVVILMGLYGWCCGKDPLLPVRRPLIEIPVLPLALLGALLAGCLFVVSFIVTQLANLVARTRGPSRQG
jgi:hypothetical protein